jgi:hypothetical protein
MGYEPYSCGWVRLTASGNVSDAGKPVLISGLGVESAGVTAASPYFNNGSASVPGTVVFRPGPNTISQGNTTIPACLPVMFPTGCYVSFDATTTAVSVFFILQSVTS